jgi:hypothetical protein
LFYPFPQGLNVLISNPGTTAISVSSFNVAYKITGLSGGAIAGIVIATIVGFATLMYGAFYLGVRRARQGSTALRTGLLSDAN